MLKSTKHDAFPKTPRSWICTQLGLGEQGLAEANRHVMAGYAKPLKVYFRGSSFRSMADADEIVNAFFADRLSRPDFLAKWETSQRPMRYWLLVGFRYFLMEQLARRSTVQETAQPLGDQHTSAGTVESEFHREVARTLVRQAAVRTEEICRRDGLGEHWDIWIRHHLNGRPLTDIACERGEDHVRVKVMARTAGNRFRRTLRELLTWPGASQQRVDQEIHELITTLGKDQ